MKSKLSSLFILLFSTTLILTGCASTEPETVALPVPTVEDSVEEPVEEIEAPTEGAPAEEPEVTIEPTEEIEEKSFDDFEPWTLEEMLSLTFEERCHRNIIVC